MSDSLNRYMGRPPLSAPRRLCGYLYNRAETVDDSCNALGVPVLRRAPVQSSKFKVQSFEIRDIRAIRGYPHPTHSHPMGEGTIRDSCNSSLRLYTGTAVMDRRYSKTRTKKDQT
jgi:hypothetical protein